MTPVAADARRLGRLYLTAEALPLIFAAGAHAYVVRETVVPEDAEVVAVDFCAEHRMVIFTVWSSSYPVVPEGQDPPAIVPLIRTLDRLPMPSVN